jgi:putative membrane protein
MLLAVGIYPQFINGVAEVTTFKFRAKTVLLLACVVGGAAVAIVGFAGLVSELVIHQRSLMYAMFIGLTLGGVPILWKMLRPLDPVVVIASIVGIGLMVLLAFSDAGSTAASADDSRQYAMLLLAGIAGGSAMILPGVSGGYLLLILGQYVIILTAISGAKDAVGARDWAGVMGFMHVFIPLGIGVLVGIVGVSNLVKVLLAKFERATLGVLLGFLLGAVVGLWPFQESVAPVLGDTIKGIVLETQVMVDEVEAKDWPAKTFTPNIVQVAFVLGMTLLGFALSMGIAHLGGEKNDNGND